MPYAELHAKSNFSFLEGASHAEELVERAVELGYTALAVTDRNSLAGVVRAHGAAKDHGLKLVIGAEITPDDGPAMVLWTTDRASYGRLARLITRGRRQAVKGECRLKLADVLEHAEGLMAGVLVNHARKAGGLTPSIKLLNSTSYLLPPLTLLGEAFADRCYLLAELHYRGDDQAQLDRLVALSQRTNLPLVAAGDVHFHSPERQPLSDLLTALRHNCTVATAGELLFPNAQRYLRAPREMAALFARAPKAIERAVEIAARSTFSLDELRYEYPEELAPAGLTPSQYLQQQTWQGARRRYPDGVPEKVRQLVEHELTLIDELHYEAYFLTVWDLVVFARSRGILCQGRGSAANSAVCFCLGVTSVDPERMDVLFERFVSRERNEAPDIDVDFEHERREEVLQYLYQKYGRERAGMTAVVITYRRRSAIRDVGRGLGLPPEAVDRLAKRSEHRHYAGDKHDTPPESSRHTPCAVRCVEEHETSRVGRASGESHQKSKPTDMVGLARSSALPTITPQYHPLLEDAAGGTRSVPATFLDAYIDPGCLTFQPDAHSLTAHDLTDAGIDPHSTAGRQFLALLDQLVGFPRHLSQHTGGMVMTRGPLCELVPIENAAMTDRTVIQWNKDDLDELGILKVDCLALGMLTAIRKCFEFVKQHYGRELTLATVPQDDAGVYEMACQADTMGVFQIESRAQMSMLPRLKPREFYDLVIQVAIVRPGPIQGDMVHPYLRRRNGEEPVIFPSEAVREVLKKTLGVPLFQEQAMSLAMVAAGFTPGEADQLRRAMGAWRRPGVIDQFRQKFIAGMLARGFTPEWAEAVFHQIRGFGEYGFPESHAASFALLVYVSAWLKHHYMAAFTAALSNSQPLGFYAPAQLVRNAREHGVEILPVDVNLSDWDCTLEAPWHGLPAHEEQHGQDAHATLALRLGLRLLFGLPTAQAEQIVARRGERPYASMDDFARRTGLSRAAIVRLAKAGAFGSLGSDRRRSLWDALGEDNCPLPLFDSADGEAASGMAAIDLPQMSPQEEVLNDYRTQGLSLKAHPLEFLRVELESLGVAPAQALATLPNARRVSVAGLVLVRQRPSTAKGITFVTLEDETGTANLIIRPHVWQRYRTVANAATVLLVTGILQREGLNIHVLVSRLEDFSIHMREMTSQSRDFC